MADGEKALDEVLHGKIEERELEKEMRSSYLDYAMSVIVGRALPDVRDGLKPVHRRVLYAMHDLGLQPNRAYRKCAFIVGEVMGKYHPHGDSAIYETLVADGAGLRPALPARRRPGQLRLDRRRPGGGDAVHGGPPRLPGHRDAPRHRCGHRRLRPQLRRVDARAGAAAGPLPEPARQRRHRDRRRHGDQHPAAQPARGDRRGQRLHRRSRDRHEGPDEVRQGPGLPRRRHDHGDAGHPRRLSLRSWLGSRSRQGSRRADEGRQGGDRRHRAALHGQEGRRGRPDHQDRRPRPRQEDHRDLRPPRRVGPQRDAPRDRAEARRRPGSGGPQPALQADRLAAGLRHQHGRAGRRRAEDPQPARAGRAVRRPPEGGHHQADPAPAGSRRGPGPHPRGAADRARQPRRRDPADPRARRTRTPRATA